MGFWKYQLPPTSSEASKQAWGTPKSASALHAVSPLATLDRGYAIVSREGGGILLDAADAAPGTIIEARLAVGKIRAKVEGS